VNLRRAAVIRADVEIFEKNGIHPAKTREPSTDDFYLLPDSTDRKQLQC